MLAQKPETLTVAPYLSEVPVDATALFSKRSPQESRDGWKAATENRMREMARIVRWKDATTKRLLPEQLTVGLSPLPHRDHRIADFDRSNPQLFVESHWKNLPKVSVVVTHKYLIVPLLKACKGDWFWKMWQHRHAVDNGAVLATTWTKDGVSKIIFFVRHCKSCANFLKERGRGQHGSKATMCLNVEAIRGARCTLFSALRSALNSTDFSTVRLFSSGQPRAMQTALALVSDAVDERWLWDLAHSSGMYTDCADEGLILHSSFTRPSSTKGKA
jgi:broad specificity phosphatase PhoE